MPGSRHPASARPSGSGNHARRHNARDSRRSGLGTVPRGSAGDSPRSGPLVGGGAVAVSARRSPRWVHRHPPAHRSARLMTVAARLRGSPLWTPGTTRSAGDVSFRGFGRDPNERSFSPDTTIKIAELDARNSPALASAAPQQGEQLAISVHYHANLPGRNTQAGVRLLPRAARSAVRTEDGGNPVRLPPSRDAAYAWAGRRERRRGTDGSLALIFTAFLAYCLHVTLGRRLRVLAPGLTSSPPCR
jgi:hypothetical protein